MTTLKEAYNEIIESNLNEPEERKTYLQDLTQHGAISGMVSGLIYYNETTQFFNEHRDEILSMLHEMKEETGLDEKGLFGDKWNDWEDLQEAEADDLDTLEDVNNQNLLAWFAVEELAKKELEELEAE
ncbi:hypothetical protein EfsSzw1_7 [Enterococcus phage EfsSzw-1]|uniref:DUF7222 domain-containing protein n=1 Tax=Enterococcus phage EfsSzw-1 TaxID=2419745 RepID=A0A411B7A8_9CAUD|nr:hypothetical protein EfsSzw1_7 [Enterococcus phage EfsSzw-1]